MLSEVYLIGPIAGQGLGNLFHLMAQDYGTNLPIQPPSQVAGFAYYLNRDLVQLAPVMVSNNPNFIHHQFSPAPSNLAEFIQSIEIMGIFMAPLSKGPSSGFIL